jgi:SsrA-binding protein
MSEKSQGIKVIARNRKARHEYHILQKYEAGLVLTGTEVKSLREGKVNLSDAYGLVRDGELFIHNLDIPEYSHGNRMNHEPKRKRKLLMHKSDILKISIKIKEKGLTLVPVSIYFKGGWAKVELALAKGKRLYDKRESLKKKDDRREMDRAVGKRGRG